MKSSVCVWLGIWLYAVHLLPPSMVLAAEEEAAKALVERADRIRFPQGGYQVHVRITTFSTGREPDVREYEILSKGNERSIVRTLSPASDKGQILLMRDRDLWLYMRAFTRHGRPPACRSSTRSDTIDSKVAVAAPYFSRQARQGAKQSKIGTWRACVRPFHFVLLAAVPRGVLGASALNPHL